MASVQILEKNLKRKAEDEQFLSLLLHPTDRTMAVGAAEFPGPPKLSSTVRVAAGVSAGSTENHGRSGVDAPISASCGRQKE